jgi:site-specific DNA recombinase
VVPAEAEAVLTIFERYLALGSIRTLAADLDRRGIRSKPRQLSTGRSIGGGSFGVGALAYLLKNRFYIGEVVYRQEVYRGEQAQILDRHLFEAVQHKLAAQAVERRCRLRGSAAVLTGRLFDDRGNRMSPSHTNKQGARYRYYVSQALLQRKSLAAGAIGRVPAAEIEALICAAVRGHSQANGTHAVYNDRELVERYVERATLTREHIHLQLCRIDEEPVHINADKNAIRPVSEQLHGTVNLTIPWTSTMQTGVKGIIHVPAHNTPITPSRRDVLLMTIAKARNWADELAHGRAGSFAELARREGKVERHVRLLVPLAFVSPRIISGLLDGTAPAGLTITALARALPWAWAEQEQRLGFTAGFVPTLTTAPKAFDCSLNGRVRC